MRGLILLFFLAFCSVGFATTYYVAPSTSTPAGNDSNPGTKEKPWKTWGKGFTSAFPGDTVYFRGGVYPMNVSDGSGYRSINDGRAGNLIYYWAYPSDFAAGNRPILDCGAVRPQGSLNNGIYASANYCHFKGLTIRNVWGKLPTDECLGWRMTGNNSIIELCTVYNTHGFGFRDEKSTNMRYINCDTYNNCDSLRLENPGNDGYGFAAWNTVTTTGSVYYYGCRAWNCGDDGFVFYSKSYVEVNNCWSFGNGQLKGGGHGYKLGFLPNAPYATLLRKVTNSLAVYNRAAGFTTNDHNVQSISCNVYNNTAYHNGYFSRWPNDVYGFYVYNSTYPNEGELKRVFRNNISYDNEDGSIYIENNAVYSHDHNTWDVPVTLTAADFISLDSTGISGPRQADGSLPDLNGFLKLKSTSRAVDAGVDVGLPFYNKPDLGAYEYDPRPVPNKHPSIAIISPAGGSTFKTPATIAIIANASDPDGSVIKVEFFNGTVKIGELTSAPWSFTWNSVPFGTYSLTAVATDNSAATTTSSAIFLNVNSSAPTNQPPVITISNPKKGEKYSKSGNIDIDVIAYDPDGTISKVEFFNGSIKLAELVSAPWSFTWKNVGVGIYSITAVATDNLNATTASSPVEVNVEDSPITPSYDANPELVNLYPNPNNGIFTIERINPSDQNKITITSYDGKVIYNGLMLQEELPKQFDFSYIKPGLYILKISSDYDFSTKTFIKN